MSQEQPPFLILKYYAPNRFDREMIALAKTFQVLSMQPARHIWEHNYDKIVIFERTRLIKDKKA